MKEKATKGKIITFYSYKGGTGRTMALANVACILAKNYLKTKDILIIDWDLEAPGLHRFFHDKLLFDEVQSNDDISLIDKKPGLIDFFYDIKSKIKTIEINSNKPENNIEIELLKKIDFNKYLLKTTISGLKLFKAGSFDENYHSKVNSFDWEKFYNIAPWFFSSFADYLSDKFEFVLIDSRTGITDISGICTILMPEKLVVVFTPNRQSLTGIPDLIYRATNYRKSYSDLRPLVIFPLISRIDKSEKDLNKFWRYGNKEKGIEGYQPILEKLFKKIYNIKKCDLDLYFNEILIQHIPYYSYGEEIAVLDETPDRLSLSRSYENFARCLLNLQGPWETTDKFEIYESQPITLSKKELANLEQAYLNRLMKEAGSIVLSGIDPKSIFEETNLIDLPSIYTPLMVLESKQDFHSYSVNNTSKQEYSKRTIIEVLNDESRLVLLGNPGSGKSTFINFVTLCLAGELSDSKEINLRLLTASNEKENSNLPNKNWLHGKLLPVRILLREFAANFFSSTDNITSNNQLLDFINSQLGTVLISYFNTLKDKLHEGRVLVMLDGLDEVPDSGNMRELTIKVIDDFVATFPNCRYLVTSRPYGYTREKFKFNSFSEAMISPLQEDQIDFFINNWYKNLYSQKVLNINESAARSQQLKLALRTNKRLNELASNPLILTLIVSLHIWRGGSLPEHREQLYSDIIDLLLDHWEKPKSVSDSKGNSLLLQPSLGEWLKIDRSSMRNVLNKLAFEAYKEQSTIGGLAKISQEDLVNELLKVTLNPDLRPQRIIEYISNRAGLLVQSNVSSYTFPHRTIQEYLTACYLADNDFPDKICDLLLNDPDRWREITILAGLKVARGSFSSVWHLIESLCYEDPPKNIETNKGIAALTAAQVLIENNVVEQQKLSDRHKTKFERLRNWLFRIIETGSLTTSDRFVVGKSIAKLGDIRFRSDAWFLPDDKNLGFVKIPSGEFIMGNEDFDTSSPMHKLFLKEFFIGKYPVTTEQFNTFLQDAHFKIKCTDSISEITNLPIVNITWYEAIEYCKWLTEKLKTWKECPLDLINLIKKGWQISLPSEAEWEKAAKGTEDRVFPWGNEINKDLANYNETRIFAPSSVGIFSSAVSPYGVYDMSGNVCEWTRTLWGKSISDPEFTYPYNFKDGREDLKSDDKYLRILRGGSFIDDVTSITCSNRSFSNPNHYKLNYGFRVVLTKIL